MSSVCLDKRGLNRFPVFWSVCIHDDRDEQFQLGDKVQQCLRCRSTREMLPNPYQDMIGLAVYNPHILYLGVPLENILLVDTQRIYPY